MKKLLALMLVVAMSFSLVSLSACSDGDSQGNSAPPSSGSPASNGNTESDDTVYTLIASTHTPGTTEATIVFQKVLDEITARSNGRIQFEVYTDGTLAAADGILEALESGIADVAMVNYSRQAGRMDLVGVCTNPGLYTNSWEGTQALMELYDTVPAMQEELDAVGLHLMGIQLGTQSVVISKTPVNDITDLAGLRVVSGTSATDQILLALGATPLGFSNTDAYEALSKGTADAIVSNSLSGAAGFGIQEVAKYVFDLGLGAGPLLYCISDAAYNRLPEDLQAIIDEVYRDYVADVVYTDYVLEQNKDVTALETFEQAGATIVEPTQEQIDTFQTEYAAPVYDEWVESLESSGHAEAREVLDTFIELCNKHAGTCTLG